MVNELIKIYKSVFSFTQRAEKYLKMDKSVKYVWLLIGAMGIGNIVVSAKSSSSFVYIFFAIYILTCLIGSYRIGFVVKKNYTSFSSLEREFVVNFMAKVAEKLSFDFKVEKERLVIEEYLQFHVEKEKHKKNPFSLFRPIVSFLAYIIPIILPFVISEIGKGVIGLLVIVIIYIAIIWIVVKGVTSEINGLTRMEVLLAILDILNEEKIRNLQKEILEEKLCCLLEKRDFEAVVNILGRTELVVIEKDILSKLVPMLYSIENVDLDVLKRVIHEVKNDLN